MAKQDQMVSTLNKWLKKNHPTHAATVRQGHDYVVCCSDYEGPVDIQSIADKIVKAFPQFAYTLHQKIYITLRVV